MEEEENRPERRGKEEEERGQRLISGTQSVTDGRFAESLFFECSKPGSIRLTIGISDGDSQLARVRVEAGSCGGHVVDGGTSGRCEGELIGIPRHRVKGFGQIRGALQDNLLR